jgi:hypothetical protein
MARFLDRVQPWLRIDRLSGTAGYGQALETLLHGRADPATGMIVSV